jgi:hypothetical protein
MEGLDMGKHKSADEKLHSRVPGKQNLGNTRLRETNNPSAPPKGTNANNQWR